MEPSAGSEAGTKRKDDSPPPIDPEIGITSEPFGLWESVWNLLWFQIDAWNPVGSILDLIPRPGWLERLGLDLLYWAFGDSWPTVVGILGIAFTCWVLQVTAATLGYVRAAASLALGPVLARNLPLSAFRRVQK